MITIRRRCTIPYETKMDSPCATDAVRRAVTMWRRRGVVALGAGSQRGAETELGPGQSGSVCAASWRDWEPRFPPLGLLPVAREVSSFQSQLPHTQKATFTTKIKHVFTLTACCCFSQFHFELVHDRKQADIFWHSQTANMTVLY